MYLVRHQEHYIRRAELYAQWVYYVCLFFACDWLMCEEVFWDDKSDKNEIDEVVSALTRPLAWAAQASSLHPDFVNWCGGKWSSSVFKILVVVTWPPNSLEDRITHQPCPPQYALRMHTDRIRGNKILWHDPIWHENEFNLFSSNNYFPWKIVLASVSS